MKWTDINLSALQYFVDTIELGSLTKAADKNHVSRPAISQAIRRTESILGYDLITHTKNDLELTARGRDFFSKAKTGLEFFCGTLSGSEEVPERIRIACSATLAEFLVLPAIRKLKPKIVRQIQIHIGTTARIRQLVADGESRLGVMINDGKTYGFGSASLRQGYFALASRSGAFKEPLITTETRPETTHLQKILKKRGVPYSHHHQIESWSSCRKAAELMSGTCLVPDILIAQPLKQVSDIKYEFPYEARVIYRDSNILTEAELDLIQILQK
jgi:DNA-binding transcriptional LysR family regulator